MSDLRHLATPATYQPETDDYARPARIIAPSVPSEIHERMKGLQALVERAPIADWTIQAVLPSAANLRENRWARAKRVKAQRHAAFVSVPRQLRGWFDSKGQPRALVILMVRQAPRPLDGDNCAAALKAGRDGLADALGIDDRSSLVQWEVSQERCSTASLRVYVVAK